VVVLIGHLLIVVIHPFVLHPGSFHIVIEFNLIAFILTAFIQPFAIVASITVAPIKSFHASEDVIAY
jgi:hypothetical protein